MENMSSQIVKFSVMDLTDATATNFGDNTMFPICPCFTMTLLSKQQPSVREIHQCCCKTSFGSNSAVKCGCTVKQRSLECLIWVLRLPSWGFSVWLSCFPVTHTRKKNIPFNFPTQKHRIHKSNQNRGTQILAYCMFSSYVMTVWGSAHCQHYSILQLYRF